MPETTTAPTTGRTAGRTTAADRQPAQVYAVAAVSALGGLLFGYDTGIISGALLYLREDLHLSSRGQEIVVSVILVGAMVGALISGRLASRLGRRRVVRWVAAVFAVGALGAAIAPDTGTLVAARLVLGLAVGGASNMVPVYIAEVAPPAIRGRLMVLFQLMVAIGQLIAYLCSWLLAGSGGWRVMFGLAVIPAAVLLTGMTRLPESPRPHRERRSPPVMSDRQALPQQPYGTAYEQMLEKVRYEGAYPTLERADETVRLVLAGLGRQLTGDERVELARRLPLEAARVLTAQIPDPQTLTGWAFVKDLAARTGASLATTRWDTGSVFAAVAAHAGPDLTTRILRQLPTGYALLFGQAELAPAA